MDHEIEIYVENTLKDALGLKSNSNLDAPASKLKV